MNNLAAIGSYVALRKQGEMDFKAFQKVLYFITESGIPTGLLYSLHSNGQYSSRLDRD